MVYYRRRSKRAIARKPRRKLRRVYRKRVAHKPHFFTETFISQSLLVSQDTSTTNPGQVFTAAINSTPDYNFYKALYRSYRITKLQWIIMPRYGQAEPNQAEYNLGTAAIQDDNLVLMYRKTWANNLAAPSTDLVMVANNGVKTVRLNGARPIRITMRNPIVQEFYETNVNGSTSLTAPVRNRWISFDDPNAPQVGGLLTYVTGNSLGTLQTAGANCGKVFCKMTFEVSGPR